MMTWYFGMMLWSCAPGDVVIGATGETTSTTETSLTVDTMTTTTTTTTSTTTKTSKTTGTTTATGTTTTNPDLVIWEGTRTFVLDHCKEAVYEDGYEVTYDPYSFPALHMTCPDCDHLFVVSISPTSICDGEIGIDTYSFRGIQWLSATEAIVYRIDDDDYELETLSKEATVKGAHIEYNYTGGSGGGYTAYGVVDLVPE